MSQLWDILIVGAGPGGASCASLCAKAGLRTLVIEKAQFPREKVCGDCINPGCWPILERLGVDEAILSLPHAKINGIEFSSRNGNRITIPLSSSARGEIAIKRSRFDQALLDGARENGATAVHGEVVKSLTALEEGWSAITDSGTYQAKFLVAADGRNSTVARLLGIAPRMIRDRVGLQTHIPVPTGFGDKIVLQQLNEGYCGLASLGEEELNVCLVSPPEHILRLKQWAENKFGISPEHQWRSVAPLERAPISPAHTRLLFVGDAARVVEPFTGEGIYYALATGELAATHLIQAMQGSPAELIKYHHAQAQLYRGRLWINNLSKAAMTKPLVGDILLGLGRFCPEFLGALTQKVLGRL